MSAKSVAALIPTNYRREMLNLEVIQNAQPIASDGPMQYLATIWQNYIAPNEVINCPLCYQRVLNNFKELLPVLAELERESKLLEGL